MSKRNIIVAKLKSKYWTRTHNFSIRVPKTITQSHAFDVENKNILWCDSVLKEMRNVKILFEEFCCTMDEIPPEYQKVIVI